MWANHEQGAGCGEQEKDAQLNKRGIPLHTCPRADGQSGTGGGP
jgi:hypothetical protein